MCSPPEGNPPSPPASSSPFPRKRQPPQRKLYVSGKVGLVAQQEALQHAGGDARVLAASCAEGVADALKQTFTKDDSGRVFVVCGPGFNGLVGVQTAIALNKAGYQMTVYLPAEEDGDVVAGSAARLKGLGIAVCDFLPSTLSFYYDVVVDALLGVGFDGGDIRQRHWNAFGMLIKTELPILSIDVPSGWDLDRGPREVDVSANTFIKPEVLVSLGVPKNGAKMFAGSFHFIGGRHLALGWAEANGLEIPHYPGKQVACVMLSSNPFASADSNGEVYGRPGQFQGTLWTENPQKKWVSEAMMESDDELWDELD
jgi:NAD(P)H-hydrate epimerase